MIGNREQERSIGGDREEGQQDGKDSTRETEGRKERRIMREEESSDEKERKGDSFPSPQHMLTHKRCCRNECAECVCVPRDYR